MKKPVETKVFSVRWPVWLYNQVNEIAQHKERSRNWIIRKCVAQFVGGIERVGDEPSEVDDV